MPGGCRHPPDRSGTVVVRFVGCEPVGPRSAFTEADHLRAGDDPATSDDAVADCAE
jgi:hypothetical protein